MAEKQTFSSSTGTINPCGEFLKLTSLWLTFQYIFFFFFFYGALPHFWGTVTPNLTFQYSNTKFIKFLVFVWFEVLMVSITITIFRDMMLSSLVHIHQHSVTSCNLVICSGFFGKHIALFLTLPTLKMKAVHSSKTMVMI
jgi:hypothetical protein